jgi:cell division protein FtsL
VNVRLNFMPNRQFWAGVGLTVLATIVVALGTPHLLRSTGSSFVASRNSYRVKSVPLASLAGGGGGDRLQAVNYLAPGGGSDDARKMVRNASIQLIVRHPKEASDTIRQLAEQAGGFLVSAEVLGGEEATSASLTIRVPEGKFTEVREKIAKLGVRTESEKLEAEDVTKQYVDLSARLRNLRAQETQYLGILKQARTIKDTIEVSDKLNEVREQIEQQQAEFDALSKQVETVALAVSLRAEADVQVFGVEWRPLYRLKEAARDGIDGVGDYASAMASFLFFIPALLLWVATILLGAALAWRLMRWVWRILFARRTATS